MGTHQAPQHRLQEAFDLLMYPTTCLWWRKYGIITHGINPFLARFFFFCKNYPSFFPPWQPLFLLVGINASITDGTTAHASDVLTSLNNLNAAGVSNDGGTISTSGAGVITGSNGILRNLSI